MKRLEWNDAAEADLLAHADFLSAASVRAAHRFLDEVDRAVLQLREYPQSGPTVASVGAYPLRVLNLRRWRIFYRDEGELIRVVRVLSASEDASKVFL